MEKNKPIKQKIEITSNDETKKGYVTLPYSESDFTNFIKGLLGKPQALEGAISGSYIFEKGDIINIHHLIDQRLSQNSNKLVSQSIQIHYDDKSSIVLDSIDTFRTYNELRPIVPVSLNLNWIYLVKFSDNTVPEKQTINISITTHKSNEDEFIYHRSMSKYSYEIYGLGVGYKIETTNRTWGIDLESLIRNHFTSSRLPSSKIKSFFSDKDFDTITPIFFVLISLISSFFASRFLQNRIAQMLIEQKFEEIDISQKINWLSEIISSGIWANFYFGVIAFIILSLLVSIPVGNYLEKKNIYSMVSYLLFTSEAKSFKEKNDKKAKSQWITFFWALFIGIIASLIANVLFSIYFQKIL